MLPELSRKKLVCVLHWRLGCWRLVYKGAKLLESCSAGFWRGLLCLEGGLDSCSAGFSIAASMSISFMMRWVSSLATGMCSSLATGSDSSKDAAVYRGCGSLTERCHVESFKSRVLYDLELPGDPSPVVEEAQLWPRRPRRTDHDSPTYDKHIITPDFLS